MKTIKTMKYTQWIVILFCLIGMTACRQDAPRFRIGVAQCSDDSWRHKMNDEILREAMFYDGVLVEIRSAGDDNRQQAEDVRYFIDKGVDLLIISANEAAPMTPIVEEAYQKGIPVILVDRKILSDKYTAYISADNYEIGRAVGNYMASTLKGKGNVVELTGGPMPDLGADAMPHWDLAKKYDLIDFDLGVKITGAGFPVYKGKGAKLQRALIQFFLDQASEAGYLEIQPPYVVNEASGYGTGQLPDKEGQMYYVGEDNLYLIPTAEVPVTNLYRDVILSESQLPVKNCAYSACFRREAGSYGKDVRGLNRLHQFDKVEIVRIEKPENSYAALEEMKAHVQGLLEKLGLPWHILRLCGGDMSFTSAITFDFEVWSGAQKRWLEVSSVSNFETYQANRLKCRYRDADKKTRLCHTLNGSALALPRIMAALLENNQTPQGIVVPECLRRYTGFDIID